MHVAALRSLLRIAHIDRRTLGAWPMMCALGAALPIVSIALLYQFLAGVLGEKSGIATALGDSLGPRAAIWAWQGCSWPRLSRQQR